MAQKKETEKIGKSERLQVKCYRQDKDGRIMPRPVFIPKRLAQKPGFLIKNNLIHGDQLENNPNNPELIEKQKDEFKTLLQDMNDSAVEGLLNFEKEGTWKHAMIQERIKQIKSKTHGD